MFAQQKVEGKWTSSKLFKEENVRILCSRLLLRVKRFPCRMLGSYITQRHLSINRWRYRNNVFSSEVVAAACGVRSCLHSMSFFWCQNRLALRHSQEWTDVMAVEGEHSELLSSSRWSWTLRLSAEREQFKCPREGGEWTVLRHWRLPRLRFCSDVRLGALLR